MNLREKRDLMFTDGRVLSFPKEEAAEPSISDARNSEWCPVPADGRVSSFPGWLRSHSIRELKFINGCILVIANIRIDGQAAEGIGIAKVEEADAVGKAEQAAFECALRNFSSLGISAEDEVLQPTRTFVNQAATSLSDLITGSQLRRAKDIAAHSGMDAEAEAERLFGFRLGELSRSAAEELIGSLSMQRPEFRSAA